VPNPALVSTIVMTILLLAFGEIIPKTIAVANNERWAVRLAPVSNARRG
jgi:CBS domain containing-hemolysin-like protein